MFVQYEGCFNTFLDIPFIIHIAILIVLIDVDYKRFISLYEKMECSALLYLIKDIPYITQEVFCTMTSYSRR